MLKRIKRRIKKSLLRFIKLKYFPLIVLAAVMVFIYFFIFYKLPSPYSLKDYKITPLSTHIYDRNGKLLYEIYHDQNRTPVHLSDLPAFVYQASIAVEDKDFYKHQGVSFVGGILRAMKDMVLRRQLQGGSTITQQLVKSSLLTSERTIQRKAREIVLALWVEKIYTKNQILEFYINQVPYGGASYGVEEAARTYFNKHAKDLTLTQATFLAGLPQAPSFYSPYNNPDLALQRRNEVLKAMHDVKYINDQTYQSTVKEPLQITPPKTNIHAPHFVFYVKSYLESLYGIDTVESGGLNVTTTLDLDIQEQSEKILKDELDKVKNLQVSNGAVLVTRPPTGEILAMLGSVDYFATSSGAFNVTTALRQPGSSIKPLNYAVGLERHLVTPATVFLDMPTCFSPAGQPKSYCPVNYDGTFHGPVQLRFALGNSYNIPAVKMLAINGVENFVASASAFTITSFKDPKNYGLSLTLGGGEVRMTEMAQAFSAFPNRGKPRKLNPILKVTDKSGKTLYEFKDHNLVKDVKKPILYPNFFAIPGINAISPETSFLISHILLDNNARSAAFGPSSYLVVPNHAVSVKTGTTDNKKDNWTIGYTPNFLVEVWVGNNDNSPMNPYLTSGVTGAAPIWNRVITALLKNQPDLWPIRPDTIVGAQICWDSGAIMGKASDGKEGGCQTRFEYFIKGAEPKTGYTTKESVAVNKDTNTLAKPGDPNVESQDKTIMHDPFSTYCIDCAQTFAMPTPLPTPEPH
jgi:penicillin-binding protein 1C